MIPCRHMQECTSARGTSAVSNLLLAQTIPVCSLNAANFNRHRFGRIAVNATSYTAHISKLISVL